VHNHLYTRDRPGEFRRGVSTSRYTRATFPVNLMWQLTGNRLQQRDHVRAPSPHVRLGQVTCRFGRRPRAIPSAIPNHPLKLGFAFSTLARWALPFCRRLVAAATLLSRTEPTKHRHLRTTSSAFLHALLGFVRKQLLSIVSTRLRAQRPVQSQDRTLLDYGPRSRAESVSGGPFVA